MNQKAICSCIQLPANRAFIFIPLQNLSQGAGDSAYSLWWLQQKSQSSSFKPSHLSH